MTGTIKLNLEPKLEIGEKIEESRLDQKHHCREEKLMRKIKPDREGSEVHQCTWCRRVLSNSTGLVRHKNYCTWNPALRSQVHKVKKIKEEPDHEPMSTQNSQSKIKLQCEWCNRFFTSQRGVERHKTYCAWHPKRLKALKEQRQKRRDKKANSAKYYKNGKTVYEDGYELVMIPRPGEVDNFGHNNWSQFDWNLATGQRTDLRRHSNDSRGSQGSSYSSGNSLSRLMSSESDEVFSPGLPDAQNDIPRRESVIKSTVVNCNCGCSYFNISNYSYPNSIQSSPTSPLSFASTSSPSFSYPEEEDVDVESI